MLNHFDLYVAKRFNTLLNLIQKIILAFKHLFHEKDFPRNNLMINIINIIFRFGEPNVDFIYPAHTFPLQAMRVQNQMHIVSFS